MAGCLEISALIASCAGIAFIMSNNEQPSLTQASSGRKIRSVGIQGFSTSEVKVSKLFNRLEFLFNRFTSILPLFQEQPACAVIYYITAEFRNNFYGVGTVKWNIMANTSVNA